MNQSLRIAVADDESEMREYYRMTLPDLGHTVVIAAKNGRDLADQCQLQCPDLVISDIGMPELDGIEAARTIYQARPVPIILVSAHYDDETIRRAEANHILGYLVKPVRAADLAPAIAVALSRFADVMSLENLSLTDELTGLYNRRGFLAFAAQQARTARRNKEHLSLLFIDVDGLKRINDAYGHQAGDRLLQAAAEIIRKTFRDSDLLARLGGDEFGVLIVDGPGGSASATARLLRNVDLYNADEKPVAAVSLSVGATEVDAASDFNIERCLATADKRMYEQKHAKYRTRAEKTSLDLPTSGTAVEPGHLTEPS